mmetsp:Transcript_10240/g.15587  ORF Transcript_10240/g.15587 Transcript_10240/m.15587 type:complete len:83 (+) Transcript_10240:503-751(+)
MSARVSSLQIKDDNTIPDSARKLLADAEEQGNIDPIDKKVPNKLMTSSKLGLSTISEPEIKPTLQPQKQEPYEGSQKSGRGG